MSKIRITETVLRDGHQSMIATRMRTEDMLPICARLDAIGFWSLEVWGGATFDSCLRFLKEDPVAPYPMLYDLMAIDERAREHREGQPQSDFTLAYLAAGQLIGYVEMHINAWDCLAANLLVEEAGGVVDDFLALRGVTGGGRLVAGSPGVYAQLQALMPA